MPGRSLHSLKACTPQLQRHLKQRKSRQYKTVSDTVILSSSKLLLQLSTTLCVFAMVFVAVLAKSFTGTEWVGSKSTTSCGVTLIALPLSLRGLL